MTKECSTYDDCPVETAINIIGGKWKIQILYNLHDKTLRFNELQKALPKVTQKMLTQQLREMENDGIISRKVYAQVPPKVEYSRTPLGKSLDPILDSLCSWGKDYQSLKSSNKKTAKA